MLDPKIVDQIKNLRRALWWLPNRPIDEDPDQVIQDAAQQIICRELTPDELQQIKDSMNAGNLFAGLLDRKK